MRMNLLWELQHICVVTQSIKLVAIAISDVIWVKPFQMPRNFSDDVVPLLTRKSLNQHTEPCYLAAKYPDNILSRPGGDKQSETSTVTSASLNVNTFTCQIIQRAINND